jgi:hypothetical protein
MFASAVRTIAPHLLTRLLPALDDRPVDGRSIRTLGDAARVFLSRPGPRRIAAQAVNGWTARLFLGPPALTEIGIFGAVVVWWPFQEWLAHKHLLHLKPFTFGGRTIDPLFASRHRLHHRDPDDVDGALLPPELVEIAARANVAFWALATGGSPRKTATGVATYATMALLYEWTHFLAHTNVKPKRAWYARIRRNHRAHHYRNEAYWYSFVYPQVDTWLRTDPDPREVPASATAMRLHGLDE